MVKTKIRFNKSAYKRRLLDWSFKLGDMVIWDDESDFSQGQSYGQGPFRVVGLKLHDPRSKKSEGNVVLTTILMTSGWTKTFAASHFVGVSKKKRR